MYLCISYFRWPKKYYSDNYDADYNHEFNDYHDGDTDVDLIFIDADDLDDPPDIQFIDIVIDFDSHFDLYDIETESESHSYCEYSSLSGYQFWCSCFKISLLF